jgi:hypothetical protein
MTITISKTYNLIFVLTLFSCSTSNNNSTNLIGTWILDSISTPRQGYASVDKCESLTFHNQTDYSYLGVCGDVNQNFTGKYFVFYNPKRGLKTVTLIPDIHIDARTKDTIRIGYSNFDIISLTADRLQVVNETKFINRDNLPTVFFNKNEIYKRNK